MITNERTKKMKSVATGWSFSQMKAARQIHGRKCLVLAFTVVAALPLSGFATWHSAHFSPKASAQGGITPISGSVFSINTTEDPGIPSQINCRERGFKCTLRAAIEAANTTPGDDVIGFSIPPTDPNCNSAGSCTINLTSKLPDLSTNVEIDGPGPNKLNVRRDSGEYRILNVTASGTVTLSGLTITNGLPAIQDSAGGGGIRNSNHGTVNIRNCAVVGNAAFEGGGISNETGTINLTNSMVGNNEASVGGGIFNRDTLTINESTISANRSSRFGGGGIRNDSGSATILDSSISDNFSASGGGGGIFNFTATLDVVNTLVNNNVQDFNSGGGLYNQGGTVGIADCTFSGNSAPRGGGGGIMNVSGFLSLSTSTVKSNTAGSNQFAGGGLSNQDRALVVSSTFTSNSALTAGGAIANSGNLEVTNSTISFNTAVGTQNSSGNAGIENSVAGITEVKSCIIALNGGARTAPDVSGAFTSDGFNLIGRRDGSNGFTDPTDQTGSISSPLDPKLDPAGLRDNGGPTPTIALLSNSPALDKGTSVGITGKYFTDQRGPGFLRTSDNPSIPNAGGGDGSDIGAFELQSPPITAGVSLLINESCPPSNGMIDPGERLTVNLALNNASNTDTTALIATLQTSGGVIAPSAPQNYGLIAAGGSVARDFSFTAEGTLLAGQTITATLRLQDGPTNLGMVSFNFLAGPTPCGGVRLVVTSSLSRANASTVVAAITVQNIGSVDANDVAFTASKLGAVSGTPLPQNLGNLAPGELASTMVNFTNSTPGVGSTLIVGGTYADGIFSSSKRGTIP